MSLNRLLSTLMVSFSCSLLLCKHPNMQKGGVCIGALVVESLDLCYSNVLKIDGSTSSSDLWANDMKGNDITAKLWFSMYTPIVFCRLCSLCCCMTSVLPSLFGKANLHKFRSTYQIINITRCVTWNSNASPSLDFARGDFNPPELSEPPQIMCFKSPSSLWYKCNVQ